MGLIKAGFGALGSTLGDQWKEYFYCDAMPSHVLVTKGQKRTSGRSSNKHGSENVISNGSVIAISDGQCAMIVQQGQIVEFVAEAGEYTWNSSTEPSFFCGSLGTGIRQTWETMKRRFTFGGDEAKDQRIYFFNLKELMGNRYGTPVPCPSGWWITTSAWIWIFPSAATANTPIASAIPCCFIKMSAAMWQRIIPAISLTAS